VLATKCSGQTGPAPGIRAHRASTCSPRSTPRSSASAPSTWTSTRCTTSTPARRWTDGGSLRYGGEERQGALRRRLQLPAYRVARALGRSEALGSPGSSPSSRATTSCSASSSVSCCRCARKRGSRHPYNPLAGGLLTGKHARTAPPPPGSRFTLGSAGKNYVQRYWQEREFDTVDAVVKLAAANGLEPATLAVAGCWPTRRSPRPWWREQARAVAGEHRRRRPHARPDAQGAPRRTYARLPHGRRGTVNGLFDRRDFMRC